MFASNEYTFSDKLRTYFGLRYDYFDFKVDAKSLTENSGRAKDDKLSVKGSVILKPITPLEVYLSLGKGYHCNDARGTTIRIDPGFRRSSRHGLSVSGIDWRRIGVTAVSWRQASSDGRGVDA